MKKKEKKAYKKNEIFLKFSSAKFGKLFHSVPDQCMLNGRVVHFPELSEKTLNGLLALSERAPLGKGNKTLLDTKLRKVMQTDKVKVEWKELNSVLREIQQTFLPNTNLRAEFYKLLIYSKGDFFDIHRDTKKGEGHLLTLAVDCGFSKGDLKGGDVIFYNSKEKPTTWTSKGEWACWFTQVYHQVTPLLRGHRVIATYNIFADPSPSSKKPRPNALSHQEPPILNNDIWDRIIYHCEDTSAMKKLCQYFLNRYSKEKELVLHFKYNLNELRRAMNENGDMRFIGFLLNHSYSFSSTEFMAEMDAQDLIGMDRILANALEGLDLNFKVVRAHLVLEEVEEAEEESDEKPFFRIASHIEDPISDILSKFREEVLIEERSLLPIPPKYQRYFNNQKTVDLKDRQLRYYTIFCTETEYDDRLNHCSFPFYGVLWCEEMALLRKRQHKRFEGGESNLWGNAGNFAVNWYQTAVLLVDVSDVPKDKWTISKDFREYE